MTIVVVGLTLTMSECGSGCVVMSRILIINVAPHDTAAHALSDSQTLLSLFYSVVLYFALKPNLKGLICPMTENEVFKGV